MVVGGTLHALTLPPTKKSLASELVMLTRRRAMQTSDEDLEDAIESSREKRFSGAKKKIG